MKTYACIRACFTVLASIFLLTAWGGARDIYVCWSGTNNPPYTNWPDAATNIQWAVDVCNKTGDTIWISNGVYVLTNQIVVTNNIAIRGTNGTPVIDGNNANRCFYFPPYDSPLCATGTLINLFITRGRTNADGGGVSMSYGTVRDCIFSNNFSGNYGGGLYIYGGSGIFQNCSFIDNEAANIGGGVYANYLTRPRFDNCTFRTNRAYSSAGMYLNHDQPGYVVVTGCDFVCNVATGGYAGGGFFNFAATGSGLVTHCTFVSNVCQISAGGVYFSGAGGGCLSNSLINNNISVNEGGGVYADSPNTRVVNCTIARNRSTTATAGEGGGGLYLVSAVAQSCIIEENQAGASGGGVMLGVSMWVNGSSILRNCLIRNNVASGGAGGLGGGVQMNLATNLISSCTIVSNYASGSGGGIYNNLTDITTGMVENCIIYFNECGDPAYSNYYNTSVKSSYSNCCVAPEITGCITSNNITANPQFVDRASGNYRLKSYSPCVNAGVNRDWATNSFDLDGRIRIRYRTVDMGAYETIYNGTIYIIH